MYDRVQNSLENTVYELEYYKESNLYTDDEITDIIETRRLYESRICSSSPKLLDFLRYVEYEIQLLEKLNDVEKKKCHKLEKTITKNRNRIVQIFKGALQKFESDKRLFKQYVDFLMDIKFYDELRYFLQNYCLKNFCDVDLWVFSTSVLYEVGDVDSARAMIQKVVRANPQNKALLVEYLKLELLNTDKEIELNRESGLEGADTLNDQEICKIPFLIFEHLFKIDKNCKEIKEMEKLSRPYPSLNMKIVGYQPK